MVKSSKTEPTTSITITKQQHLKLRQLALNKSAAENGRNVPIREIIADLIALAEQPTRDEDLAALAKKLTSENEPDA